MKRLLLILLLGGLASWHARAADTDAGINALGRGNYPKALEIFMPDAEKGDWAAQSFVAYTYERLENFEESYAWYYAAAECGSLDAEIELAVLTRKMAKPRIEKGQAIGKEYHDKYCKPQD